jgi:hypothetical protein
MEENYGCSSTDLSISDLNKAFENYKELREDYEATKKISNDKYADLKKAEGKLCEYLETSGLDKFSVPEIGTVSLVSSLQFQTPKTLDEKNDLFGYIKNEYGEEVLQGYLSINSNTLNSFLKEEYNKKISMGENPEIPGVSAPTANITLRFNKARK